MTLREKRVKFSCMIAELMLWINQHPGYSACFGDIKAKLGHKKNSLHYDGLAGDINLYKDGKYLEETEDHEFIGLFWEDMGGSWGGRFGDGNHYSLEHEGRK